MNFWKIFDIFHTDKFVNESGENVDRLIAKRNGHDIQVLRFNGNDNKVLVNVDNNVKQTSLDKAGKYIAKRIED